MNLKLLFAMKCFGFIVGLTLYNFVYENFINDVILDGVSGIKDHFGNSTLELPDSN